MTNCRGVVHDSKRRPRPLPVQTQVIRPDAALEIDSILRTRAFAVRFDVTNGLDNEVFIADVSVAAEVLSRPSEDFLEILARLSRKNGFAAATLPSHVCAWRL